MKFLWICVAFGVLFSIGAEGLAESFWKDAKVSKTSSISISEGATRVFKKHDIITVIVSEASKASGTGTLERDKEISKNMKIDSWYRLIREGKGTFREGLTDNGEAIKPEWKLSYQEADDREGTIERSDKMETRIAAIVRDVKPNGNLVIEARSTTEVNKEVRTISVSGIVRAEDIRPDNTIPSYNVAYSEIRYTTKGPASDGAKRGWLTAIFDFINPF